MERIKKPRAATRAESQRPCATVASGPVTSAPRASVVTRSARLTPWETGGMAASVLGRGGVTPGAQNLCAAAAVADSITAAARGETRGHRIAFGIGSFRFTLMAGLGLHLLGCLDEAKEDNPGDDQSETKDGEDEIEHNQLLRLRLAVTRASRVRRTPTQRIRMLGTQRPT